MITEWRHVYEGLGMSPQAIYKAVIDELEERDIPGLRIGRTILREGGILSQKREYLVVQKDEFSFKLSAIPFSTGVIISWSLQETVPLFWRFAFVMPPLGRFLQRILRPDSAYRRDITWAFQMAVHTTIVTSVADCADAKGYRALMEDEDTPVLSDFFKGDVE
jgi:hypothetical protein